MRGVRRRDSALRVPDRRSRRPLVIVAVIVVLVVLPLVWLALQTLGGESSKHSAAAPATRTI